ncbi:unnamed protein product [Acanthoscelides obtectus]|uniref:Uncharacterized protein n=1 Tax=Acanthoscelides obtectus TaxID=200917 RepID=A0A9P0Q0S9_ACAOB|nr:unnamed protein product [Acanthoscelides obtectus]CAK1655862.1 hypothetical protein AOBTE_LOCUS19396 [Acanthoscelides obtectus]
MKETAEKNGGEYKNLSQEDTTLRTKYDKVLKLHSDITQKGTDLKQTIHEYHSVILSACPNKWLVNLAEMSKKAEVEDKQQAVQQTAAFHQTLKYVFVQCIKSRT